MGIQLSRAILWLKIGLSLIAAYMMNPVLLRLGLPADPRLTLRPGMICLVIAGFFLSSAFPLSDRLNRMTRSWVLGVLVFSLFLLLRGIVVGNPYVFIAQDVEMIILLLVGVTAGSSREMWPTIDRFLLTVTLIGSIVMVVSISEMESVARDVTYGVPGEFKSLAYQTQYLLWPTAWLILTLPFRRETLTRLVIIGGFVAHTVLQVLFQKRFPLLKIAAVLMSFVPFKSQLLAGHRFFQRRELFGIVLFLLVLTTFFLAFLSNLGLNVGESVDLLVERLTGQSDLVETSSTDVRFYTASVVLENLSAMDFLIGRGFGDYLTDSRLFWAPSHFGSDFVGVTAIEVGQVWPVWRGGIPFLIMLNAGFVMVLFSLKRCLTNPLLMAAWITVSLQFFSFFVESLLGAQYLNTFIYGVCIGLVGSIRPLRPEELSGIAEGKVV